ncbi:MAG: GNAT family N-acetyltransferase [Candidatus Thorarchaeota archaeon]
MKEEDWDEFHKMDIEIFPDDVMREESFRKSVEGKGCFALTLDRQIIGNLIVTRFGKDAGYLNRIGVAKEHRGKGFSSKLMEYALNWFHKQSGISTVQLYADLNEAAQGLYRKHGFTKVGATWHYFVPYNSIRPKMKFTCREIQEDEIELVGSKFPSIPPELIRRYLTSNEHHVLTLKDKSGNIQGVCRFTPSFPGCMPFEITSVECFDDFIAGLMEFKHPEHDYCRVTYTDIPKLAELCENRGYQMHHKLYKMLLNL